MTGTSRDPTSGSSATQRMASIGLANDLRVEDLAIPGVVFQIGLPPLRIAVLTAIDGVEFPSAWRGVRRPRSFETVLPGWHETAVYTRAWN